MSKHDFNNELQVIRILRELLKRNKTLSAANWNRLELALAKVGK